MFNNSTDNSSDSSQLIVMPTDSIIFQIGSPKPTFTTNQIIYQITTSWGGNLTGDTFSWASNLSTISYSINSGTPTNVLGYTPSEGGTHLVNMDALQVATAKLSFQLWDDLIAKAAGQQHRLVQTTSPSANITLDYSNNTSGNGTYSNFWYNSLNNVTHNGNLAADEIWLSSNWSSNGDSGMSPGKYGLITMIHEIGHSLGLSHPGVYDAGNGGTITYDNNAVFAQDNRKYTVMSYFGGYLPGSGWQQDGTSLSYLYPQTPMVYDIAAIQAKYGADTITRTGNTTYGFNCTLSGSDAEKKIYDFNINHTPIFTIWDAGGIDTLDCSGYAGSQTINLTPGSYSSVDGMIENVAIAFNCHIEKAIGGAGNDTLIAVGSNTLTGSAGADTFNITSGTNTITDLGNGADIIVVSSGAAVSVTANGNFTATSATINNGTAYIDANGHTVNLALAGGSNGWKIINSSATGVTLVGSAHNDIIYGGSGNDTITGGGGNDLIWGGLGADLFNITSGTNSINDLSNGTDILKVSSGATATATAAWNFTATSATINNGTASINANGHSISLALAGGANGWTLTNSSATGVSLIGSSHNDTINGGSGNDTITGGNGNDTLFGGAGSDKFVFNVIPSATNHDTITDFVHGLDILQLSKTIFNHIFTWASNEFYSAPGAVAGHSSTDRIVYNSTTGNLYYDADGNGAGLAVLVALIGTITHPTLDWHDIQLVA